MSIGVSLLLVAIGGVLIWAVDRNVGGVDVSTIGVILLVVGVAGLLTSLLMSSSRLPWRSRTVVDRDDPSVERDDAFDIERSRR
jgi:hypothetical protein